MNVKSPNLLEVLEGDAALQQFENKDFLVAWDNLYDSCPWRTIFQSKSFVLTWYRVFSADYSPVLITAREGTSISGIFTLARSKKTAIITGAGSRQAEYHAWLCDQSVGEEFAKTALAAICQKYPRYNILFTYIPPKAPVEWLKTERPWKNKCFIRILKQPLVQVDKEFFAKKLSSKTIREKTKRLQRLGDLRFERITDFETFVSVLDELIIQYEFRKGAMYNIAPFKEEPAKKTLLIELFKLNMLHVTVLKIDDRIIASAVNTVDKKWICFKGLNAHAPNYSKQSPGLLHLLMLGKLIAEEGLEIFDLTPGDDFYKDKLATHYADVAELWITSSRSGYYKLTLAESVKRVIRNGLTRRGIDPRIVLTRTRKLVENVRSLKQHGLAGVQRAMVNLVSKTRKEAYLIASPTNISVTIPKIKKDNLADLLLFDAKGSGITRWDFLKDAMKRFELGEHCFTLIDNGRLLACAWLRGKYSEPVENFNSEVLPLEAEVIHTVYAHPALKAWIQPFLNAVAEEVCSEQQTRSLYLVTDSTNRLAASLKTKPKAPIVGKGSYLQ